MVEQICLVTGATDRTGDSTRAGESRCVGGDPWPPRSSKASYDEALAERLWTVSERLVGLS